jgi:hypothetical protein
MKNTKSQASQGPSKDRESSLKFKFSSFYSPFNVTNHCCTPKIGKNSKCISALSELEKNFLLTLLQNAKHCHITRQENLEFLGAFDGGARITSISGIHQILKERLISFTSMKKEEENTNCTR